MPNHVLILAAGQGTRMRSSRPKVLHRIAGLPLIEHVLRTASTLSPASTAVVVGHLANQVREELAHHASLGFAHQTEQRGTGHALLQAEPLLGRQRGSLVVLSGDVPLIRPATLQRLIKTHERTNAAVTVLTATLVRPYGYGRIVRKDGRLSRIVEERDASEGQRQLKEINGGIYAFDLAPLFGALREIPATGAVNEIYLPGLVTIYRRRGLPVETVEVDNPDEVRGINSQTELAEVRRIVRQSKNEELMAAGVTIEDPATTYVDTDVTVGPDTVIHPGVILEGRTIIGSRCELHAGVRIVDSTVGDDVLVNNHCVIHRATIAHGARVGPFAHLRPDTQVGEAARVGNFVELKKTSLGDGSKANHLSYLGDATIGTGVNVGAGTITCNYDGDEKHRTTIGDRVFVGSGTELVAPVTVGDDAYVAAGSCITDDVPADALGVARGRQVNKEGWVTQRKQGHDTGPSDL
ncbi:MAG: bifunctional UDP-N-acetylglucosamine diphosphorylase/glucosamine-1-phosphate N-acetyltransferase GlmU [Acidobacteria bacterium]|jgi:bifunctional UDP-N-acetylglucosamine pyrophosphorylase/glucosamine-1-phosphate N-acetyltransferase|nr:bifunctional UDP-N-acetylglucosamine diphosphorylase/glucosamine-1-phosphate N-acetyltransferase GlmU [Acidobacteriota bacterium]MDP7337944.1 bifunctional UDP-N-acetylglucosamine diphosphorylase/glucosamine-1-phosphate N-acetyltransferase GlmU [Vicinamibacterales bacterium]MDP7480912.1 bifunctional UDP-N-acetylglucosamine diphosphorylase/glucosamine-1-phosphate N-acetyltransferase GlmU [Vicinamibacterales bacterium]MDP7691102.1 bifunctional UDP-N-acetylglucosamine diphosphorylase/glucosamine-|tara:strand:+ start:4684 stop:6081 length:1398 start_codon:yes stop_codon:yes gene_type:complete